ncbi:hypothetical protein CASFOL_039985 [Castilleja foliolosa]|uniref:Uncharacterized protein n=1 Tax=Castilleja foliolosa TaxID=1961234 RepID=A0ABD3BGQ8_9LAMI
MHAPGEIAVIPNPLIAAFTIHRLVPHPLYGLHGILILRRESTLRREAELDGDDNGGDLGGGTIAALVNHPIGDAEVDPSAGVEVYNDREAGDGVVVGWEFGRAVDSDPRLPGWVQRRVAAEGGVAGGALGVLAGGGGGGELDISGEGAVLVERYV